MKLAPLISTPTESISALAAAIVQRHKALLEIELEFDRQTGRRDAWQRLDRTEEPTKVEVQK